MQSTVYLSKVIRHKVKIIILTVATANEIYCALALCCAQTLCISWQKNANNVEPGQDKQSPEFLLLSTGASCKQIIFAWCRQNTSATKFLIFQGTSQPVYSAHQISGCHADYNVNVATHLLQWEAVSSLTERKRLQHQNGVFHFSEDLRLSTSSLNSTICREWCKLCT